MTRSSIANMTFFTTYPGVTQLQINTDYINLIHFMMYFIFKWEHNGWMTIKGTPVKNQTLIRELDYFSGLLQIKWVRKEIVQLNINYIWGKKNKFVLLCILELCSL